MAQLCDGRSQVPKHHVEGTTGDQTHLHWNVGGGV